jgi:predicted RNA methylase
MQLKKRHVQDIMKIMGIEEEMIGLLPMIESRTNTMNPWLRQLPGIFRGLRFKQNHEILDIPCGEGGVSVALASNFGVKVTGYDIIPEYIIKAKQFATQHGVEKQCTFSVKDIREAVTLSKEYDALLWLAPPHIWGKSKPTIKALRKCVKYGGIILIGDAYLFSETDNKGYNDYETLEKTTAGYTYFGDRLTRLYDYRGKLWAEDYNRERKAVQVALAKVEITKDQRILERYLNQLNLNEKMDKKCLGLAIWLLQLVKPNN